jgi:hypothetical protein
MRQETIVKTYLKFGELTEEQEAHQGNVSFIVNVGNVGNIEYSSEQEAREAFSHWVKLSKASQGRASGEDVELMIDGEPVESYFGDGY